MSESRTAPALRLAMATAGLGLVASTWPLWTGTTSFPQIPFLEVLCGIGPWADRTCLALILAGAVSTLTGAAGSLFHKDQNSEARGRRNIHRLEMSGPWIFALGLGLSVLLNQHRLQPWVWHFLLVAPLIARRPGLRDWRNNLTGTEHFGGVLSLTAGIYFWSAVSKLDASFAATHGQQFVETLFGIVGMSTRFWSDSLRSSAAMLLPLSELVVAVLIVIPRTWKFGWPLSIVMHGLLLLATGPFGLNHQPGVLIWNAFFVCQNMILWRCSRTVSATILRRRSGEFSESDLPVPDPDLLKTFENRLQTGSFWQIIYRDLLSDCLAVLILACGLILPGLRWFGLCDPWPGWAVYASQPARVTLLVEQDADVKLPSELPSELRPFVQPRQLADGRAFVRIDLWSIEETGAPLYPGERFAVGVALWLSEQPGLDEAVHVVVQSEADRWSIKRDSREFRGRTAIREFAMSFRINTQARTPHR